MWVAFAKATHIFFSKSTCELDIVLTRTVNILTTNELIKLTILWTIGPWFFSLYEILLKDQENKYLVIFLGNLLILL